MFWCGFFVFCFPGGNPVLLKLCIFYRILIMITQILELNFLNSSISSMESVRKRKKKKEKHMRFGISLNKNINGCDSFFFFLSLSSKFTYKIVEYFHLNHFSFWIIHWICNFDAFVVMQKRLLVCVDQIRLWSKNCCSFLNKLHWNVNIEKKKKKNWILRRKNSAQKQSLEQWIIAFIFSFVVVASIQWERKNSLSIPGRFIYCFSTRTWRKICHQQFICHKNETIKIKSYETR